MAKGQSTEAGFAAKPAADRIAAVAAVFKEQCAIDLTAVEAHGLAFVISRIATAPREMYDAPQYAKAMKAARLLADLMPGLIRQADALAARARDHGMPSSLDQFAENGKALIAAIKPFNVARRDQRGWWHPWAAQLAQQTAWVMQQREAQQTAWVMQQREAQQTACVMQQREAHPNFSTKTSPAVLAMVALLELAGLAVAAPAVVDALKKL